MHGQLVDLDRGVVEPVEQCFQRPDGCRRRGPAARARRRRARSCQGSRAAASTARMSANRSRTCPPGTRRFSSSAVPSATMWPWSSTAIRSASSSASSRYWVVRKIVTPLGDELADDLPHRAAAARVQAGGRLVEEDDPRVADQRHREVEPALHAAGVGRDRLLRRLDQVEPLQQLGRPARAPRHAAGGAGPPSGARFSSPVSRPSTAENWPVTPIAARTASASRATSWPATRTSPPSAPIRVDRIWTAVVLPAPFGSEQREDRSLGDVQVDAVEHRPGRRTTSAVR